MINNFAGKYRFLSNFYPISIFYEDIIYQSVENAYQAAKSIDPEIKKKFQHIKASEAKHLGKVIQMRDGFEQEKLDIMYRLVKIKFNDYTHLGDALLATGNEEIQEGNWWGDTFWGTVNGHGQNHLGKIIMRIRTELRESRNGTRTTS